MLRELTSEQLAEMIAYNRVEQNPDADEKIGVPASKEARFKETFAAKFGSRQT